MPNQYSLSDWTVTSMTTRVFESGRNPVSMYENGGASRYSTSVTVAADGSNPVQSQSPVSVASTINALCGTYDAASKATLPEIDITVSESGSPLSVEPVPHDQSQLAVSETPFPIPVHDVIFPL